MEIRKAKRSDWGDYLLIRKETLGEYLKKIKKKKVMLKDARIKKEFSGFFNKRRMFLVAEENGAMAGYLTGTFLKNAWQKTSYVDDVFILKEFRGRGIGSKLIKKFMDLSKTRGVRRFMLGVDVRNEKAIKLYKKLGFKISQYGVEMRIK